MQFLHDHIAKDGFRLRGTQSSRIDSFSDVAFGFALTLMVVSLEVPRTYDELHKTLVGFIPFFFCFWFLIVIWRAHFQFFRRYGLHDNTTILINCALLFTVLFYVYPLKFLVMLVATVVAGGSSHSIFSSPTQMRSLMTVYGAGFAGMYFCLAALYFNAWRQRVLLRLNPLETMLTLTSMWSIFGIACIGVICCIVVHLLPADYAGSAGYSFFLITIWRAVHAFASKKHIRKARAHTAPEDLLPLATH